MDLLSYILCLLVGICLPVAAFYLGVRRAWRQLAAAEAYREVARRLGLSVDTRGLSLHGYVRDRRLWVGQVMVGYGPERATEIRGVLGFKRPLGLALHLRPKGATRRLRRRSKQLRIPDAELDKRYHIHGDDLTRVGKLLCVPEVRAALAALAKRWPRVVVTDHGVRVNLKRPENSTANLFALVEHLERLAVALESARKDISVPERLDGLVERFRTLGERTGLELEPWFPALVGEIDGRRLLLAVRRTQAGYRMVVRTWFHEHPELGLGLFPQVKPDGYWSVGQDIQLGDEGFDSAFVIKGFDPNIVRERLTEGVRSRLLALHEIGTVEVNDHFITVRGISLDHEDLEGTLLATCGVATEICW